MLVKAVKVLGDRSSVGWSQEHAQTFEKNVNRVDMNEEINIYF